jgi:hypothetical protein
MESFNLNDLITEAEQAGDASGSFEDLPPNMTFLIECAECEIVLNKTSGKPQLKTRWKVADGPYADRSAGFIYLTPIKKDGTRNKGFFSQLSSLGIDTKTMKEAGGTLEAIAPMLVGRQASTKTKIEKSSEYGDRTRIGWLDKPQTSSSGAGGAFPPAAQPPAPPTPLPSAPPSAPAPASASPPPPPPPF